MNKDDWFEEPPLGLVMTIHQLIDEVRPKRYHYRNWRQWNWIRIYAAIFWPTALVVVFLAPWR